MSEKVTIPREVAEAIEYWRSQGMSDASIVATAVTNGGVNKHSRALVNFVLERAGNSGILMRALLNGYEVEQSPEERVREYYDNMLYANGDTYADIIKDTVDLIGIKIKGGEINERTITGPYRNHRKVSALS
jgi:hypothetical protein